LIVASLLIATFASACTEADFASFGSAALSISADLDKHPDPDVKAAGAASSAIERKDQADLLAAEAIDKTGKLDFIKMDKAIDLDPTSADLRLQKAAMQVSAGLDATTSVGEARFLTQRYPATPAHSPTPSKTWDGITVWSYTWYLSQTMDRYDKTSAEYSRLRNELCAQARLFKKEFAADKEFGPDKVYDRLPEKSNSC
jgi:hypothetical protein